MRRLALTHLHFGDVLRTSRPYLWLLTGAPFVAGYLVARNGTSAIFWLGLVYFIFPYNLFFHGLKHIEAQTAKWLAVTNLPLIVALLVLATPAARLWLIAALLAATAYHLKLIRFRELPLLDALCWGFVVSAPLVFGLLQGGWRSEWLPAVLSLFSWAVASHIFETIQTLEQDRQAGQHTAATWLGAKAATVLSTELYLFAGVVPLLFYGGWGAAAAAVLALYVLNTIRFIGVGNPELFSLGWRAFLKLNYLAAIILSLLLILSST